jgi:8-oxo-dGTP pyrophosphatase MutT (NUDIX family)
VRTTWDGLPVAPEPPFAASVVVWREGAGGRAFLLLHRLAPGGPAYQGDWAWTPPSGARLPGEEPDDAARRELTEETGLMLEIVPARGASASADVALYVARAAAGDAVVLDAEHDRFEWLSLDDAIERCAPAVVAQGLASAAAWLEATSHGHSRAAHSRHEAGTHPRGNPR